MLAKLDAPKQAALFIFVSLIAGAVDFSFHGYSIIEITTLIGGVVILILTMAIPWYKFTKPLPYWHFSIFTIIMVFLTYSSYLFGGFPDSGNFPYYTLALMWISLNFPRWLFYLALPHMYASFLFVIYLNQDWSQIGYIIAATASITIMGFLVLQIRESLTRIQLKAIDLAERNLDIQKTTMTAIDLVEQAVSPLLELATRNASTAEDLVTLAKAETILNVLKRNNERSAEDE